MCSKLQNVHIQKQIQNNGKLQFFCDVRYTGIINTPYLFMNSNDMITNYD